MLLLGFRFKQIPIARRLEIVLAHNLSCCFAFVTLADHLLDLCTRGFGNNRFLTALPLGFDPVGASLLGLRPLRRGAGGGDSDCCSGTVMGTNKSSICLLISSRCLSRASSCCSFCSTSFDNIGIAQFFCKKNTDMKISTSLNGGHKECLVSSS